MTKDGPENAEKAAAAAKRQQRLAEALRKNLRKRRTQDRARKTSVGDAPAGLKEGE